MFWYIVICILMLYPFSMVWAGSVSGKNTNHLALVSACMILCFFMAMRGWNIGVDTKYYCYVFEQFRDIPWSKILTAKTYATEAANWSFDFEPGYRIYNKILSCFSDSGQFVTISNSILIFILLYRLVRKNSPDYLLSIWLYITLGIYQTEMNVTRNAIAILFLYNAFVFIEKKQPEKYVLCCLLASSFHVAAIAFVPIYWIVHNTKLTIPKCIGFVSVSMGIGLIFPLVSPYITSVLPYSVGKYFIKETMNLSSLLVGALNAGVFFSSYLMVEPRNRNGVLNSNKVGMTMLLLNMCLFGLNINVGYAARMAALFGPYLIIFIPRILEKIESKNKKNWAKALIIALCGVMYIARLMINNIGGTMPYEFFWQ